MATVTRQVLTDSQWERIEALLPNRNRGWPYSSDYRTTIWAILWIASTVAPWRDLPDRRGKWMTVLDGPARDVNAKSLPRVGQDFAEDRIHPGPQPAHIVPGRAPAQVRRG